MNLSGFKPRNSILFEQMRIIVVKEVIETNYICSQHLKNGDSLFFLDYVHNYDSSSCNLYHLGFGKSSAMELSNQI